MHVYFLMVFPHCLQSISTYSTDVIPSVSQMNKTSSGQLLEIKLKVNYLRKRENCESSQEYCYISWCIQVFEFWTSFKVMCNKLVIILTAISKANACRTLNQKRRDYGFPCPVMTRDDKHNSNNRLSFPAFCHPWIPAVNYQHLS